MIKTEQMSMSTSSFQNKLYQQTPFWLEVPALSSLFNMQSEWNILLDRFPLGTYRSQHSVELFCNCYHKNDSETRSYLLIARILKYRSHVAEPRFDSCDLDLNMLNVPQSFVMT